MIKTKMSLLLTLSFVYVNAYCMFPQTFIQMLNANVRDSWDRAFLRTIRAKEDPSEQEDESEQSAIQESSWQEYRPKLYKTLKYSGCNSINGLNLFYNVAFLEYFDKSKNHSQILCWPIEESAPYKTIFINHNLNFTNLDTQSKMQIMTDIELYFKISRPGKEGLYTEKSRNSKDKKWFAANGKIFLKVTNKRFLEVYKTKNDTLLYGFEFPYEIKNITFNEDETLLAISTGKTVYIFDTPLVF